MKNIIKMIETNFLKGNYNKETHNVKLCNGMIETYIDDITILMKNNITEYDNVSMNLSLLLNINELETDFINENIKKLDGLTTTLKVAEKITLINHDNIFKKLIPTECKDTIRYYLNGSYLDFENKNIVSTDGHRLTCIDLDKHISINKELKTKGIIIPSKISKFLSKVNPKNIDIELKDDFVCVFYFNDITLEFESVDGKFASYLKVIPKSIINEDDGYINNIIISRKEIELLIKKKLTENKVKGVKDVEITVFNGSSFNFYYLKKMIEVFKQENYIIFYKDTYDPYLFKINNETDFIIMPMKK